MASPAERMPLSAPGLGIQMGLSFGRGWGGEGVLGEGWQGHELLPIGWLIWL